MAGGAVAAVPIGLLALTALSLPFVRSMGYGGMLIALVSTLVAITLLWTGLVHSAERRRWIAAGASVAAFLALLSEATQLRLGDSIRVRRWLENSGESEAGCPLVRTLRLLGTGRDIEKRSPTADSLP